MGDQSKDIRDPAEIGSHPHEQATREILFNQYLNSKDPLSINKIGQNLQLPDLGISETTKPVDSNFRMPSPVQAREQLHPTQVFQLPQISKVGPPPDNTPAPKHAAGSIDAFAHDLKLAGHDVLKFISNGPTWMFTWRRWEP